MRYRP